MCNPVQINRCAGFYQINDKVKVYLRSFLHQKSIRHFSRNLVRCCTMTLKTYTLIANPTTSKSRERYICLSMSYSCQLQVYNNHWCLQAFTSISECLTMLDHVKTALLLQAILSVHLPACLSITLLIHT